MTTEYTEHTEGDYFHPFVLFVYFVVKDFFF
jgi:hypothetical protein